MYADIEDIQAEYKDLTFSDSTAVTEDDVCEFINQESNKLNAQMATVYVVPITGTISRSIMKSLTTLLVKARIEDILQVKTGNTDTEQGPAGDGLRKQVADIIEKILKKDFLLVDATLGQSSGGVKSYSKDHNLTQKFRRFVDQW